MEAAKPLLAEKNGKKGIGVAKKQYCKIPTGSSTKDVPDF